MALGFSGSGTVVARARAIIEADTSSLGPGLRKAESDFDSSSKTMESHAHRLRQALDFGTAFLSLQEGFHLIDEAGTALFDRWQEQQKIASQTEAVLTSTGGVAGVTAKQIDSLAESLQRKTSTDAEQIKQGENMMLSFRNVRNEAGKTNDVFNQSIKSAADMAAAFTSSGKDMSVTEAALQLGKALNDPEKGLTRLMRIGVTFTQGQRDQVKALVDSGHAMQAQKIILAEVNREFGGSAEAAGKTLPGQLRILKLSLEDTATSVMNRAMPALTKFTNEAVREVGVIEKSKTTHKVLSDGLSVLHVAWTGLTAIVTTFVNLMHNSVLRTVTLATAGIWLLNAAIDANPFAALATAAVLAVGVIVRHWQTIVGFFRKIWNDMERMAYEAVLAIVEPFSHLPGKLGGWARKAKDSIKAELAKTTDDASSAASRAATAYGETFLSTLSPFMSQAGGAVAALTGGSVNGNARAQAGGTAFALTTKAKQLGVGSGGVYVKGGGHGGVAKPGTMLDCSGYVYQVFTQSGFKGFPGTSETQWSTHSGQNWTSERVAPSAAKPGDVVFMVGSPEYPSPGHVGIVTDGAGMTATVMQYYSSGKPADTIPLSSIGDLVGIKRFYLVTKQTGTSTPTSKPPASTTPAPHYTPLTTGDFTTSKPSTSAASKAAAAARKAKSAANSAALKAEQIRQLREQDAAIEAELPNLTTKLKAQAKPLAADVAKILATGIVPNSAQLARAKTDLGKLKSLVAKALADAKNEVTASEASFSTAWSTLGNRAMTAFDAATTAGLAKVTASTSFGTIGANDKTPAEIALAQLQAQHDAAQQAADMAAAQADQSQKATDLQSALASGDPDTIAQAKQAYDDATKTVADLAYNAKVAEMQAQADAQRTEADKALSDAQAQYQTQRDLLKENLQAQLDDLNKKLTEGRESYSDYMTDVAAILNDPQYGTSIGESGANLGSAFASAFHSSMQDVAADVNAVITALNRVNALTGKPPVGSISLPSPKTKTSSKSGGGARAVALASGGVAWDPTHALIADGGTPEVVVPVSREIAAQLAGGGRGVTRFSSTTRDLLSDVISLAVGGSGSRSTERPNVVNHINLNTQASPDDPASWLRTAKFAADHVFGS